MWKYLKLKESQATSDISEVINTFSRQLDSQYTFRAVMFLTSVIFLRYLVITPLFSLFKQLLLC